MMAVLKRPISLLIAVNLLIGFFVYREYGLSWDEPYFYSYGDALGYAYSPVNWFSEDFDLDNSYGVSGDDHKTRGPAYLFLARNFAYGLEALGSESAAAWHLVNFLFFQLGIILLYRFATRWMTPAAAFAATLLFSTQPLLWGHAFINPKDPPFLTFFLGAVCFGFEMVDALNQNAQNKNLKIFLAAFFLGIATSIRVLGPLAGVLVFLYFLSQTRLKEWRRFVLYGVTSVLVMFATWPYLWENPLANFIGVFRLMSDNPTNLAVLFNGEIYRAGELPRRYLPFMLTTTLTEPIWILFVIGLLAGFWKTFAKRTTRLLADSHFVSLTLVLAWLLILLAYVFLRRPAMYDGFRHFLFILPPVFVFAGLAFEFLSEIIRRSFKTPSTALIWLRAGLLIALILPGPINIFKLHPYEYTYYNSFVGGMDGAFRKYETDYWLTCYKEAVEELNVQNAAGANLFVKREAYIAEPYAADHLTVRDLRGAAHEVQSGDYVLMSTRTNEDRTTFREAPIVIEVKRGDATFCIVRQIP